MDPFEDKMNKALQKLADDIIPSDEYLKKQNNCADNIIKLLQTKSKFKVDRVCIAGSSGKKTTIIGSDIDCVLFINEEQPPFEDVLEDFENILNMTDSFNIRDVHKTKYSLQFKVLEFEFDILPAANFTEALQGDASIDIQRERVLRIIEQDPKKNGYMYSSSLAFSAIRFMKQQNGFVNQMVRIAKFWYKTLRFNDYVSGAKNCIELIAVYAAIREPNMSTKSFLRSFQRFINYIQNFDGLNIHFEKNEHRFSDNYRPRVMDPVNPYNNLAREWDSKSIQLVKCYAEESNRRLQILANSRVAHLDQLYEPQPVYHSDMREIFEYDSTKSHFLIGTATFSLLPDLKVRNELFHTDPKLKKCLEMMQIYFQFAIHAAKASNYDKKQIEKVVENTISRQICNKELTWSSAEIEEHEDYDITFTIPIDSTKAKRISYRL